jgi:hypothetical protein
VELYTSTNGNISDLYTHRSVRNKTYITNPINQLLTQLLHAVNIPNLPLIMQPPPYINNPINQLLTQLLHVVNIPNLPLIMPPSTLHN